MYLFFDFGWYGVVKIHKIKIISYCPYYWFYVYIKNNLN